MDTAELFPPGDYRLRLTLRRGAPAEFFAPRDATGRVLAERRRWIAEGGGRYARLQDDGPALLEEFLDVAQGWPGGAPAARVAAPSIATVGGAFEPDLLLLSPDAAGQFRLRGGALCFPTGWALEEKIGHTLDWIHGVVPGLNAELGPSIAQFLGRMKPGVAFLRDNWGIAATAELNLHPCRSLPAPARPVDLARLWLRVEHQALVALPRTGGLAFGIRIALHRLDGLVGTAAAAGLGRALRTMPAELAAYKRLADVREELVARLEGGGPANGTA